MSSPQKQKPRGGAGASPSLRQGKHPVNDPSNSSHYAMKGVSVRLTDIGLHHNSPSTDQQAPQQTPDLLKSPKKRGRPRKSESVSEVITSASPIKSLRSPLRSEGKVFTSEVTVPDCVKVTVVTDSEDSAVEVIENNEVKKTKVVYLHEKPKSYKKDKKIKRKILVDSDIGKPSKPINRLSLNDIKSGRTPVNKIPSGPNITECVVKLVKKDMTNVMSGREEVDTSDEKEITFNYTDIKTSEYPSKASDMETTQPDTSGESVVIVSTDSSVEAGPVMLKFIDSSGKDITETVKDKSHSPERPTKSKDGAGEGGLKLVDYDDSLDTSESEATHDDQIMQDDIKMMQIPVIENESEKMEPKKRVRRSKRNSVTLIEMNDEELKQVDETNETTEKDSFETFDDTENVVANKEKDEAEDPENGENIEPDAGQNQSLAEINSSIESQMKEDFGIASEEDDVTDAEPPVEDDTTIRPDPIRESPSFFSKADAEHETVCEPKSSPIAAENVNKPESVEIKESEVAVDNASIALEKEEKSVVTTEEFETNSFCILEKVDEVKEHVSKESEMFVVQVEDESLVGSNAEICDEEEIVDDHDYGFKSPGREFGKSAVDILSRVSGCGGPKVEVESSPCLPVVDVLNRFTGEKFDESEVESDCIDRGASAAQEFSADDEAEEFVVSSAWSSLNLIMEPLEQSPAKTKLKKRVRKKSSSKSRSGSEKSKCESSTKKSTDTSPSSTRKYRKRSSKMASLLDTGTDTDDQSPVRPRHVPSKLEFKDSDHDRPVILPPAKDTMKNEVGNIKDVSLTMSDSYPDKSNGTSPSKKSVGRPKKAVIQVSQPTIVKRNIVELLAQEKSPVKTNKGGKNLVVGVSALEPSNTDTETEYNRPRLLIVPTTGTDTETDTDKFGREKNLIRDLARVKGKDVRRSLDVFGRSKQKQGQGRHSTGSGLVGGRNWEPEGECPFSLAEIVWARVGAHPWWPSMVTNDPDDLKCERIKPRIGQHPLWEIHVVFFGENNRAWVDENHLKAFTGTKNFEKEKQEVLREISINKKSSKQKMLKAFTPNSQMRDRWEASVQGAEKVLSLPEHRRMTKMVEINRDLCESIKRKRKLSGDSESSMKSIDQLPASKRVKLEEEVEEVVKGLKTDEVMELGRNITGYKLFKLGQREQLARAGFTEEDMEEECLAHWEELSQVEKKAYNEQKRSILEKFDDDGGARRSAASQRQLEVKARQEEKEKREKEKGPGWYYVLEPVKQKKVDEPEVLIGNFLSNRCCSVCEEATGDQILKCRGPCGTHYHPACLQMEGGNSTEEGSFKCTQCQLARHKCFLCKQYSDEVVVKVESMPSQPLVHGPGLARKCAMSGCGKWYHDQCLTSTPLWPQARIAAALCCPDHTCHTCASDNTRDPVMKYSEKLMHCVRCPTAYHGGDHCVAAGTIQITKTDIVCPKHYKPPSKNKKGTGNVHVNASWCFVCSKGGSLICCEICPSSFHTECLNITTPPEGKYHCDDCISGRMPLYNDLAWIKLGNYRWWPARVLHPSMVPDNIEKLKHQDGEFPIQFLGSGDYYWINHGRAFLYEEGDSERVPSLSSTKTMDASFKKGLIEAEELFKEMIGAKVAREAENSGRVAKNGGASKPTPYVKLKSNKPYGNCPVYAVDPGELQPCDCDRKKENPCGEDSNCLNRMLMFECHPAVCPAKEMCRNMRFQKRQYPPIQVVRSDGRGWGLKNQESIKKGQFVIEYVGELITMVEYRARMAANQMSGEENYYYLTIDSNRMIDAGPKGNMARFMNHSCDPNCITQKWTVNGDTRVGLFALKDIETGSELTFNYQFETVGETKKKCMCGAANCSGLIGEKPQNKEKDEKKLTKKKKSKPVPVKLKYTKVWEDACYRCSERGTLLQCDHGMCPKVYHPLCVGKEAMPRGKWHCPWHYCVECGTLVTGSGTWCRHCPNAYCKAHKEKVKPHEVLGVLCDEHGEEEEFLLDTLRASSHGLSEILPCPSPTPEQLAVWRKARGVEPVPVAQTDTHSESEASNADSKESKPRRSRFSVEPESRESSVGVSRAGSVQRESMVQHVETHEAVGSGNSIVETVVVVDDVVTAEDTEVKVETVVDDADTFELSDTEEIVERIVLEDDRVPLRSQSADRPETPQCLLASPGRSTSTDRLLSTNSPSTPLLETDNETVEQKKEKLAALQEMLAKLKTPTPEQPETPLLSPRRSKRDTPSQELTVIGNQSVVCSVENCSDKRQFDLADYGKHFSVSHRALPLEKLLVTNERGVQYAVLDIYKFVYRCGYIKCAMLFFGISENSKADFVKKVRKHWYKTMKGQKSHRDLTNRECAFDNIIENYAFVQKPEVGIELEIKFKEEPSKPDTEVKKIKTPEWKVRKNKTPAKSKVMEEWEVFDFRKDEQIFSKCYQNDCSFIGTDEVHKMQTHLKFHGLTSFEIDSFAKNEEVMGEKLKKAMRVLYKNLSNETVGVGPQVYMDTKEAVCGAEKFLCQAVTECSMSFLTEKSLLDHCKQVHPSLKPQVKSYTPQKLEFGGTGFKCQNCQAMITCVAGSDQFFSHWMSHLSDLDSMRFLNMETSQVMELVDIYPYSAKCQHKDCQEFFSSQSSFEEVEGLLANHWSSNHTGETTFTTTSYKKRNSPRKQARRLSPQIDLDPLELEGPFRCEQCSSELVNANSVFQHSSAHHKEIPLTSLNTRHLASNRVFLNTALYRYVLQCGVHDCHKFAGRNSCMEEAIKKLKKHWKEDHSNMDIVDFCYLDIGVEHDEGAHHNSKDDSILEEKEIKKEPSIAIKSEVTSPLVGYLPLQLSEYEGPFSCTHAMCDFTCNSVTIFGKHWNMKHTDMASKATFIDQATSSTVSLYQVYTFLLQCKLCGVVRCARDVMNKAVDGMSHHLRNCHSEQLSGGYNLHELHNVLQDQDGRRMDSESDPVGVFSDNYKLASYQLLIKQGILHNQREMVHFKGPFRCHLCGEESFQKQILMHWAKQHPAMFQQFRVLDVPSLRLLGCHDLFKCLAVCPDKDCGTVLGQNSGYDILKYNVRYHYQKKHGDPGDIFDFMIIVPPEENSDQIVFQNAVSKVEVPDNPPVEDYIDTDRVPTIAEFTPERSNTSFSQKGYYGPYHCLREGCGFVCDKFGLTTQKLLVNHWSGDHGDVKSALFLDISSFTILNVKVICNNVGYCSYDGCSNIMYGSRKADFPTSVANHWKNTHPSPGNSYNPNMCKVISTKQVPAITEEEAISLVSNLNLPGISNIAVRQNSDTEKGRTPARGSTRISPRKLEQGARKNYVEEEPEDSMQEDNEDGIDQQGPYKCSECEYTVAMSIASNRAVLNHWVKEHSSVNKLKFVDVPTGEILTARSFFRVVGQCSSPQCNFVMGNNRYDTDMYRRIRLHWNREHVEDVDECTDADKLNIIDLEEDEESVCSENSDLVDPDVMYNGPYECVVDNCEEQVDHTKTGWKMKCLNHFLQEHDHAIDQLRIRDTDGRMLKIQHLFQYVGQCNQAGCHMIKGINGRNKKDGNFELERTFKNHYRSEHPDAENIDFTCLVENHEIRFVSEKEKKKRKNLTKTVTDLPNPVVYRCNFCDKEFPRQDSLAHWNSKQHLTTPISMLTYTDTTTMSNVKVSNLFSSVGQCISCEHYLGSNSNTDLMAAVKDHYANNHNKLIFPNTTHYKNILEQQTPIPTTPASYGSDGYICCLCDHKTTAKYIFKHWNSNHPNTDITLMEVKCVKTNTKGDIYTIFPLIGQCKIKGCGHYYGASTRHHPLKRVGGEHFKKLHGSDEQFEENVHMRTVEAACLDVRMSVDSISQPESDGEEGGLLTCSIPGCGDNEISSYTAHFSRKHKDLPLDKIRVHTEQGKLLTLQDLFNFALKCDLCKFLTVTGHSTIKNARKSMRKHWLRDHQDMKIENMAFTDIMPQEETETALDCSPVKKQKISHSSPSVPFSSYSCVECGRMLELRGGVPPLQHWTKQHPHLPPAAFRVSRVTDSVMVGLRDLYPYIVQCQAPSCLHLSVSYQSESEAVSKVKEHWMRQHNRACDARFSAVAHLGYLCTQPECNTLLASAESLPEHHSVHTEVLPRDMAARDLETGQVVAVGDIYTWVRDCPAECGAIFYSNCDEESAARAGEEHWDREHGDMPRVGSEGGPTRGGYQCMAGADEGEVGCSTIIPEGNNGNALRHWQYKHSSSPLRDLVFMNQSSGDFLQISNVFSWVLVCNYDRCGLVTYTNYLNRGGRVMDTHWEKEHGSKELHGDIFKSFETPSFLSSNHIITKELFVDFEHEEDFENIADDNLDDDVVIDDAAAADDAEAVVEEIETLGFKCGVPECQKMVAVSRFVTAMVALNRLKKHFSQMHRDLPSEDFKYEEVFNHDLKNAVNVVVSDLPSSTPTILPPPPAPEYPTIVYQCPAMVKSKSGPKPCPERQMDANTLRIHWGSQHNVDGQIFSPLQLNILDTSHYMCSAAGCSYSHLTIGPLRTHWDKEHQDQPNRFQVVFNEVKVIKPVPVPEAALVELDDVDEAPMIPVGRKSKVPPLPEGCSLQCSVADCGYQTESSRDLAVHSRECGQPWYVCQIRGCGHKELGITAIKEHMEVVHRGVKVEDWDYKEESSRKRARSSSVEVDPEAGPSNTTETTVKRAKVECDVSANFDLTGLDGSTTGDSDSDFDLDYTVV